MKKRVLFLGDGNSARSQMAEALLRNFAGDQYDVFSAGTHPTGVHPMTVEVMKEINIDVSGQTSKNASTFEGQSFDYVIALCDRAKERCPDFHGAEPMDWGFDDPAEAGTRKAFQRVREEISTRLRLFVLANNPR